MSAGHTLTNLEYEHFTCNVRHAAARLGKDSITLSRHVLLAHRHLRRWLGHLSAGDPGPRRLTGALLGLFAHALGIRSPYHELYTLPPHEFALKYPLHAPLSDSATPIPAVPKACGLTPKASLPTPSPANAPAQPDTPVAATSAPKVPDSGTAAPQCGANPSVLTWLPDTGDATTHASTPPQVLPWQDGPRPHLLPSQIHAGTLIRHRRHHLLRMYAQGALTDAELTDALAHIPVYVRDSQSPTQKAA